MTNDLSGRFDPSSGHSKDLLLGFIRRVRSIREQIKELNADKAEIKKEARDAGFDSTKIEEVVTWLLRVDKHGREAMDEAEAIFDLYRDVVDGKGQDFDAMMDDARDRALLKIFAPDDQSAPKAPTRRQKSIADALAGAQAARRMPR